MNLKRMTLGCGLLAIATTVLSGCTLDVSREADGSLWVEATVPEEDLETELEAAIADPLVRELAADLRDGTIFVTAERDRVTGEGTDTVTFRLDLGVSDGHLTATVSDLQVNGVAVQEERVAVWNERIATRLTRASQRHPNSTLQAVAVGDDALTMTWRIETRRSGGD